MQIAISTFYSDFNYGALLQATALCRFLSDALGQDARILDHSAPIERQILRPWNSPRSIMRNLLTLPNTAAMKRRAVATRAFMTEHQRLTGPVTPGKSLPMADMFIAGSDQVWNVDHGINPLFFLRDADPAMARIISYAASFGREDIPSRFKTEVTMLLRRFHSISVREESGADLVERLIGVRPAVVCDPVFLLSSENWRAMKTPVNSRPERYILVYAIRKNDILERIAAKAKETTGLPVLQLLPGFDRWALRCADIHRHDIGPGGFLSLLDHAEFVCTNSFHCGAFSLLLGKPFAMAPSTLGRSTRLTNLLRQFEEKDRYFDDSAESPPEFGFSRLFSPDTDRWENRIAELRSAGEMFLRSNLP